MDAARTEWYAYVELKMPELKRATVLVGFVAAVVVVAILAVSESRFRFSKPRHISRTPQQSRIVDTESSTGTSEDQNDSNWSPPKSLRWPSLGKKLKDAGPTLPLNVINRIEKFVFFIGYPRSGHSILGSFMDAHPHVAIAHEFMLFAKWKHLSNEQEESGIDNPFFQNRTFLFNTLYGRSYLAAAKGLRSDHRQAAKNYTLEVDYPWQGKYDNYISVIGDKSGGTTTNVFLDAPKAFPRYLTELRKTVEIPIKVIHAIRNPFDLVSTYLLYRDYKHLPLLNHDQSGFETFVQGVRNLTKSTRRATSVSKYKSTMKTLQAAGDEDAFLKARYDAEPRLKTGIERLVDKAGAVTKMIDLIGPDNVLEVHNMDLVNDPRTVVSKICTFLNVRCTPDYLQACASKVFKSVSKTRDLLVWTPELQQLVKKELIRKYPFFARYSFESE